MDKIAARGSVSTENYKAEKSLVNKKLKPLISEIRALYFLDKVQLNINEKKTTEYALAKIDKIFNILKSLSSEEIKVLRWKLKQLGLKLINHYAPAQIKNSLEVMGAIKSYLNLTDVLVDESLCQDWIKIIVRGWEAFRKSGSSEEILKGGPIAFFKLDPGLETELLNFITKYSQHINKLAETDSPSLPSSQSETITQNLFEVLSTNNPNPESSGNGISLINNLLTQGLSKSTENWGSGKGSKELNMKNLLEDLEDLTKVQSKPKWYQNPWVIVPSLFGAAVVGGLVTWLFLRKKEPKKEYKEY